MTDFPADWAIERALEPVNAQWEQGGVTKSSVEDVKNGNWISRALRVSILTHARLIEKHEKPPVDPDLLLAREIAAVVAREAGVMLSARSYRFGEADDCPEMVAIVQLLKERGK